LLPIVSVLPRTDNKQYFRTDTHNGLALLSPRPANVGRMIVPVG
jgi:hypothetical protein